MIEFLYGVLVGIIISGWLAWEAFVRGYQRKLNITVTPEFVAQINEAVVMAWLDAKGLVWQPKGVDFKARGVADGRR